MAPSKADEQRYQAEDDLRTMIRYQEIQSDKARLRRAMKMAKEQMAQLKKAAGQT